MIKLDYSIESPEERNKLVQRILEENPDPGERYLEILADYLILCMEKQERKKRDILTENRLVTVNDRELSFEGLVSQFENGEDGVYNLIANDKNIIFKPKVSITKKDLAEIQPLQQLLTAINFWEERMKTAQGREAYIIKNTLIDLRRDQYIIKNAYRRPITLQGITHSRHTPMLEEEITVSPDRTISYSGISLLDPAVCKAILCNYSQLKEDSYSSFEHDMWYLLYDFENVCDKALAQYPMYQKIVECKIDGLQNVDIQTILQEEFGVKHSIEYISTLWRKKIPMLIASQAEEDYLNWYYTNVEYGRYKRCSRCGQVKLADNRYFSKNKTSRDGFYSICKCCRNKKK